MLNVTWTLDKNKVIGEVKKEIYGGFVEHLGRNVYGGVYEPSSPTADEDGFRKDVMELIRAVDMPVTRYPGGCYVDLERWQDSVGPTRRARLDPAWHQLEPNTFGLDEFMKWARKVETEPLMTVNVANQTVLDTLALFEYCNFPGGTYWSEQRRANGAEKPYRIRRWCLGNELYGGWEIGQMSAAEYGRLAREHGKLLKKLDPGCQIIVSGSPDDREWNRTVLGLCGMYADVLSLHRGFHAIGKTERQYLETVDSFEKCLNEAVKECRAQEALTGRPLTVGVDEWIIWDFERRMRPEEEWTTGMHLLEQDYTILEALIAGSLFSCFHRHADRVELACIAQSVNVIAPIRTEPDGTSWKQSIYYPFQLTSRNGRGVALTVEESGNDAQALYGSAVWNESSRQLTLFVTNRSEEECAFSAEFDGIRSVADGCVTLTCGDHTRTNASDHEAIVPRSLAAELSGSRVKALLPGTSWSMIKLGL